KDENVVLEALKCYCTTIPCIFAHLDSDKKKNIKPLYEHDECSRIIRCLSIGIERCLETLNRHSNKGFTISELDDKIGANTLADNLTALYRACHKPKSLSTNVVLLSLLSKLTPTEDRFYNLVYERLLDIDLLNTCNKFGLLVLLNKITEGDKDSCRIAAFIKRLLQVSYFTSGTNVLMEIIRICKNRVHDESNISKIIMDHDLQGEYIPEKRNPSFTKANECYLWEYHLNVASYHPLISFEYSKFKNKSHTIIDGQSHELPSLFEELGALSGFLDTDFYTYTTCKFWEKEKSPKPHQFLFKLFYQYKSQCQLKSTQCEYSDDEADSISIQDDDSDASVSISEDESLLQDEQTVKADFDEDGSEFQTDDSDLIDDDSDVNDEILSEYGEDYVDEESSISKENDSDECTGTEISSTEGRKRRDGKSTEDNNNEPELKKVRKLLRKNKKGSFADTS
ncbi:bifunctional CCAAT-binding factor/CEBPZ-Mak21-like, partial [Babesia duncani]